jgi:hypothetical protein
VACNNAAISGSSSELISKIRDEDWYRDDRLLVVLVLFVLLDIAGGECVPTPENVVVVVVVVVGDDVVVEAGFGRGDCGWLVVAVVAAVEFDAGFVNGNVESLY